MIQSFFGNLLNIFPIEYIWLFLCNFYRKALEITIFVRFNKKSKYKINQLIMAKISGFSNIFINPGIIIYLALIMV